MLMLPKHWLARLPALNVSGVHDLMPHDVADVTDREEHASTIVLPAGNP
jgi:hypothetical protein